jgi:hypothetical protein
MKGNETYMLFNLDFQLSNFSLHTLKFLLELNLSNFKNKILE